MLVTEFSFPRSIRLHAISLLLSNDPWLLDLVLTDCRDGLRPGLEQLRLETGDFSPQEALQLQFCLDVWHDAAIGGALILDALRYLDNARFEALLLALECLRFSRFSNITN
jgi:hypothetical protein